MKSNKGKAIGAIEKLEHEPHFCVGEPDKDGKGPKGNPSSAGQNSGGKSKKDGNRRKRNKGRG